MIYNYIGPVMDPEDVRRTIEAIRETTRQLLAAGPEACRQYLIDAGIIKQEAPVQA